MGKLFLFLSILCLSISCSFQMELSEEPIVAVYQTAENMGTLNDKTYSSIPYDKLTHIFHLGVWLDDKGEFDLDPEKDMPSRQFASECHENETKILLTTGKISTEIINRPELREKAVLNLVSLVLNYGYDGLDFDWEHPYDEADKVALDFFMKSIRSQFDRLEKETGRHYIITATLISATWVCHAVDSSTLFKYVDFVNLMSYDLYWPNVGALARYHAPLFAGEGYPQGGGLADQINYWINEKGIPASRIVMCLPFYTYVFKNLKPMEIIPEDKQDGYGHQNWYDPGFAGIYKQAIDENWTRSYEPESNVAWYINSDESIYAPIPDHQVTSICAKWAKDQQLRGVSAFYLGCAKETAEDGSIGYPLFDTLCDGFLDGIVVE